MAVLLHVRARDRLADARDRIADERYAEMLSLFARPAEVHVAQSPPESDRAVCPSEVHPSPKALRAPGLAPSVRDEVVSFFSPAGAPRTAAACAELIGRELVAVERAPTAWWAGRGAIFYMVGTSERALLEAVVATHLTEQGGGHTEDDVGAIAARLTRPVAVRSVPT